MSLVFEPPRTVRTAMLLVAAAVLLAGILFLGNEPAPTSAAISTPGPGYVEASAYIKFDGLVGAVKTKDHVGWSDLAHFDRLKDGAGLPEEMTLSKALDRIGPKLDEAAAEGSIFPWVQVDFTLPMGGDERAFYMVVMENATIEKYAVQWNSAESLSYAGETLTAPSFPLESLMLSYEKIGVRYVEYDVAGKPMGLVEFGWDFVTNRPWTPAFH